MRFRIVGNDTPVEPTLNVELKLPSNGSQVVFVAGIEGGTSPDHINRQLVWINNNNEVVINRGAARDLGLTVRDYK